MSAGKACAASSEQDDDEGGSRKRASAKAGACVGALPAKRSLSAGATVTTGLKRAPEIGPNVTISA